MKLNDTLRGEEQTNPSFEPGDIVTEPEADQDYVVGNVYSPKALPMKEPLTVSCGADQPPRQMAASAR